MYTSGDPPPVELLRTPQFLGRLATWKQISFNFCYLCKQVPVCHALYCFSDMLIATLFKPGTKINSEHRPKYVHILAYASCVSEIYKKVLVATFQVAEHENV